MAAGTPSSTVSVSIAVGSSTGGHPGRVLSGISPNMDTGYCTKPATSRPDPQERAGLVLDPSYGPSTQAPLPSDKAAKAPAKAKTPQGTKVAKPAKTPDRVLSAKPAPAAKPAPSAKPAPDRKSVV